MFKKFCNYFLLAAAWLVTAQTLAEPSFERLSRALGGIQPDSVEPSTAPGWYEVSVGGQVMYLSEDGRYVLQGDLVDLQTGTNITELKRNDARRNAIAAVGEDKMIIFEPEQATHTVSVFTDIDCGYCRKLHSEMQAYLDAGIRIRYLAFPRAGPDSESYNKAVSAWCADDPQEAITRAKLGESIEPRSCDNPVVDQYRLGQQLGVRGTPSILTESGEMIPGYVPAARLTQVLAQ